jgi:hypothetical protein
MATLALLFIVGGIGFVVWNAGMLVRGYVHMQGSKVGAG